MRHDGTKANILLVDDRRDSLIALESALAGLEQNLITATSGKEALKYVLKMEFAVILLDVHMPEMDGFETAKLIRQRKSCRHTPIIFITGYTDELHISEGYSLGAVDYILAPVVPEILRAKVSVFVDLFRKNQQVAYQAASLRRRATQLHDLTQASISIHSATSLEEMLQVITDTARHLLEARYAAVLLKADQTLTRSLVTCSGDNEISSETLKEDLEKKLAWLSRHPKDQARRKEARYTGASLCAKRRSGTENAAWIGMELTGRDGRGMGLLEVIDVPGREFGEDDDAILLQLSQKASIAIENILSAKAREANRLKDEFLATLSHELRTPLNAILGWIRLLCHERLDEETLNHGLQVIERNVEAQSKLIEDLLDISRITSGKLRLSMGQVGLKSVVEAAMEGIRPSAKSKEIDMAVNLAEPTCDVWADPDRLQQVVSNLLSNAVKFTPQGGRIDVALEHADGKVRLRISDSGQGIDPEVLPYVFDHFRQADSSTTREHLGLGVGLAIVRHIVHMHGGSVFARSAGKGQGSTFVVELPLLNSRGEVESTVEASVGRNGVPSHHVSPFAHELSGLQILVVDDEADARELLTRMLQQYHAHVLVAGSADEAMEILEREAPDVLLSDIAMPGKDGYALIRRLRASTQEELRRIPAVALTAHARENDVQRAIQAGFQAHIAKPIEPERLLSVITQLLGRDVEYA